jgi:hypothetical protein
MFLLLKNTRICVGTLISEHMQSRARFGCGELL